MKPTLYTEEPQVVEVILETRDDTVTRYIVGLDIHEVAAWVDKTFGEKEKRAEQPVKRGPGRPRSVKTSDDIKKLKVTA